MAILVKTVVQVSQEYKSTTRKNIPAPSNTLKDHKDHRDFLTRQANQGPMDLPENRLPLHIQERTGMPANDGRPGPPGGTGTPGHDAHRCSGKQCGENVRKY
ncbi:hypothetical protein QR680_011625 [Steinernema hermaphroditum]|uniref:Uncharacterized protein n=1 Tax=Steinernema hermaphroditum TaxID=289476 RepID=A0AA39LYE2_9BILA|nr:hypothetical protein QR680_011625 [Steinernema hermaphroditum]